MPTRFPKALNPSDVMSADFWFKFKFKDYIADTRPLSLTARGILMEIIIYMESNKTYWIPNDVGLIVRLTGGTTEEITHGLSEFFRFASLNFEKNERGEEIIVSRKIFKDLEKSRINAENGKKGGNPQIKKQIRLTEHTTDGLTESVKPEVKPRANSVYDSYLEGRDKGVKGEKRGETNDALPGLSEDQIADIPNIVTAFAETCLNDFRLHDSLRQKNPRLKSDDDCRKFIREFAGVQVHGLEYYHRIQAFKTHMLRSPLLTKFDPINPQENRSMISQQLSAYEEARQKLRNQAQNSNP